MVAGNGASSTKYLIQSVVNTFTISVQFCFVK